jgi:hypothetical protein
LQPVHHGGPLLLLVRLMQREYASRVAIQGNPTAVLKSRSSGGEAQLERVGRFLVIHASVYGLMMPNGGMTRARDPGSNLRNI